MRKCFCALWMCAVLLIAGCSAGTPDSTASEKAQSEAKTEETAETETSEETEEKESSAEDAAAADTQEDAAQAVTEEAAQESAAEDTESDEEDAQAKDEADSAKADSAKADAESEADAGADSEKDAEKDADQDADKDRAGASEQQKTEKVDKKQESAEKYVNDYIPEGFSPYGSYVLVYDSGYEVKTRLSQAGLTYYYGSEEFLFTLNKDLPDMTKEVAHILFNTSAPMDPANTEGEEFPFGEGFTIYINLDNGSYYEVYSSSMDLNGRIFARDIFELFREKWQDAF